jgi:hypothetical protein
MRAERKFADPPPPHRQGIVLGLRGGAAVLMVAAFEAFLDDLIEEQVQFTANYQPPIVHDKLPNQMRVHDVYQALEIAMKGPKHTPAGPRVERLAAIRQASMLVANSTLSPSAFSGTAGNPGKTAVTELFKRLGFENILTTLKPRFESHWRQPVAAAFVGDKLDEIIQRRHRVAHRADALTISRSDLKEGERFLRTLATVLDIELAAHVRKVCRSAR